VTKLFPVGKVALFEDF